MESALEQEKRRLKNLQKESHKRERSMARAAERAGGGELGSLNVDGNTRALKEACYRACQWSSWHCCHFAVHLLVLGGKIGSGTRCVAHEELISG